MDNSSREFCIESAVSDAVIISDGWDGESLQDMNNRMRLPPLERDSSFKPTKVSTIREKCGTSCPA